jgi:superoxide dismutase, Fe-Mn family
MLQRAKHYLPLISPRSLKVHIDDVYEERRRQLDELKSSGSASSKYAKIERLEALVRATASDDEHEELHGVASDVYNHEFFFASLMGDQRGARRNEPPRLALEALSANFDGFERFKFMFSAHANAIVGAGFTWLVDKQGHWQIVNTYNRQSVLVVEPEATPLLNLDVYEHSYYLDYGNDRDAYVRDLWQAVNWHKVVERMQSN